MPLTPNIQEVIASAISAFASNFYTALPGIITDYNADAQVADVAPAVVDSFELENGVAATQSLPILPNVPVMFLSSGPWRVTFPVSVGDTCLLVFASAELGTWLATGQLAPPATAQRNHVSDAVAIVGLRPFPKRLHTTPDDHMSLGTDDGCTVEIYPDEVRIGGDDTDENPATDLNAVVIQSALDTFMTALGTPTSGAIGTLTTAHDPSVSALQALQTALNNLGGWKAGTVCAKAK